MRLERGFSLLELILAVGVMLAVTASVFALLVPAQGSFMEAPEVADMQQRLRVVADTLQRDLVMAGNGPSWGQSAGPLNAFLAPVLPSMRGAASAAPWAAFQADAITLIYVPPTMAQTTTDQEMPRRSGELTVRTDAGCPEGDPLCGFTTGMTALVFSDNGSFDTFSVTSAQGSVLGLQHEGEDDSGSPYPGGTKIVQAVIRAYYVKADETARTYQLVRSDGPTSPDQPVVDNVVGLLFEYYGEPQASVLISPVGEPIGPWTTYGPKPPALGRQTSEYPAGENCLFRTDATSGSQVPRLDDLGGGRPTLVKLTEAQLTDGPWCPDGASANRFDADLLRIRKIGVTIRVQSAVTALRGPAGALFAHGGTSSGGGRFVPDQEVRFHVSPRNVNLGR